MIGPATTSPGRRAARGRSALPWCAAVSVAVALIPLVYLLVRTAEAGWERVAEELFTARVLELAARSVALAAVVTAACLVLGVGTAVLVVRTDLPLRRGFAVLAALPLAVPSYVAGYAWISAFPGFEGFWAAALVLTLGSTPYVFLPVAAALRRADPAQEEVAAALGHGPLRVLLGVTVRQVRPAVAGGALLVALYVLADFGAVAVLRADTFTRAIFLAFDLGFDRTGALVLSCVLLVLTALLLGGETATRRSGARHARTAGLRVAAPLRLGRARWPAAGALLAVGGLAFGVVAAILLARVASGVSRPGALPEIAAAAATSVGVSALGAALTVLLALPLGFLAVRRTVAAVVLDRLAYLTHALPGLVVGLSLVFFGIGVAYPLYQTVWLLALAYAALFLPLAAVSVAGAAASAPPALGEVARSLGRGPARVALTVSLPLVLPGVGAGAALVFLSAMKELPATLLLRPTGADTLATELWTRTTVAAYAAATPYAFLLVLISAFPAWVLVRRTGVLAKEPR